MIRVELRQVRYSTTNTAAIGVQSAPADRFSTDLSAFPTGGSDDNMGMQLLIHDYECINCEEDDVLAYEKQVNEDTSKVQLTCENCNAEWTDWK